MQVKSLLQKAGLDEQQVQVYLGLITLGEATAGQIARLSGVPRTYTYKILEQLAVMDLVQSDSSRSIRRYSITDFEAPRRYLERRQLELYRVQQEAQHLHVHLESLANPTVSAPSSELLKDEPGLDDFWRLLHSTLTREVWIMNPPDWWTSEHHPAAGKWQQYRQRQHIWEKRFVAGEQTDVVPRFTDIKLLPSLKGQVSSLFVIDHYQVQVSCWSPFRAVRIEHAEMTNLFRAMLSEEPQVNRFEPVRS